MTSTRPGLVAAQLLCFPYTSGANLLKVALLELGAGGAITVRRAEGRRRRGGTGEALFARGGAAPSEECAPVLDALFPHGEASPPLPARKVAQKARQAFGPDLGRYRDRHLLPLAVARGWGRWDERRRWKLLRTRQFVLAQPGRLARADVEVRVHLASKVPRLVATDPARAVELARTAGPYLLLHEHVIPHLPALARAMQADAQRVAAVAGELPHVQLPEQEDFRAELALDLVRVLANVDWSSILDAIGPASGHDGGASDGFFGFDFDGDWD